MLPDSAALCLLCDRTRTFTIRLDDPCSQPNEDRGQETNACLVDMQESIPVRSPVPCGTRSRWRMRCHAPLRRSLPRS